MGLAPRYSFQTAWRDFHKRPECDGAHLSAERVWSCAIRLTLSRGRMTYANQQATLPNCHDVNGAGVGESASCHFNSFCEAYVNKSRPFSETRTNPATIQMSEQDFGQMAHTRSYLCQQQKRTVVPGRHTHLGCLFALSLLGIASLGCAEDPNTPADNASTTEDQNGVGGNASSTTNQTNTGVGSSVGTSVTTGSSSGGANPGVSTEKFSFFVTSYKAIAELAGTEDGFGGDLRYGETGDGSGLRGADKICTEIAERSMAKNGKAWRAFLSTSVVDAIDRIGEGPWYDRRGRVFAMTKADLLATRPIGADQAIINDFPNEDGVTNHAPNGSQVDNHDMITGSGIDGKLYRDNPVCTCSDWTSSAFDNTKKPRVGHSWPRSGGGGRIGSTSTAGNVEGMSHWISALDESGCGAGVNIDPLNDTAPGRDGAIGSGGGYGGFYCFALTP